MINRDEGSKTMARPTTPTEGREALAKVLDRECERAKEQLETTLRATRASIDRALDLIADGKGVPTTVSGTGMILGSDGVEIDHLAGRWMETEQRRVRLLDLYDEANGTAPEAEAVEESTEESIDRWNEERVGDGPDFGMYTPLGNAKVAEVVENASRVENLDQAWDIAREALFALADADQRFAEAGDTAVRDLVYEDLRLRFA